MPGAGQLYSPSRTLYAPASIFRQDVTGLPRAADQSPAKRLANQLFYGTSVEKAGAYFGYSGMGYAGNPEGSNTLIKTTSYNVPLWVVKANHRRQKVWVFHNGEPNTEGDRGNVQEDLDRNGGVPLPDMSRIRSATLAAEGTDEWCLIVCKETDESWEFIGLSYVTEGPYAGRWKCSNAHYQPNVSKWNGITGPHSGQGCAAGTGLGCGLITIGDLLAVARGAKEFGHAIGICAIAVEGKVAPARLSDSTTNTRQFLADGVTPNPAFGTVDQVPEGLYCAMPKDSRASDFGFTGVLKKAFYETLRLRGWYVQAKGSTVNFPIADPKSWATPYSDAIGDPFRGSEKLENYAYAGTTPEMRAALQDPSIEQLLASNINNAANGLLAGFPWRESEGLEPRSS